MNAESACRMPVKGLSKDNRPTFAQFMLARGSLILLAASSFLLPAQTPCQNSKVAWSSFDTGFAFPTSSTTAALSAVGQSFAGPAIRDNTQIASGFLGIYQRTGPVAAVNEHAATPLTFALLQNYPNPFNPKTVVSSQYPVASWVRLVVYDVLGREVAVLVDEQRAAGAYRDVFDGNALASGMYVYRLTAGSFVATRRMLLLK